MGYLNENEIYLLIQRYKNIIRKTKNTYLSNEFRYLVVDLYRELHSMAEGGFLVYTNYTSRNSTSVKVLSINLLNQMGYTQNTIYREECEHISQRICNELKWEIVHGRSYSNEALSSCIVSEILDYYNSEYDEIELIKNYNIPINTFIKLSLLCHEWCKERYWRK